MLVRFSERMANALDFVVRVMMMGDEDDDLPPRVRNPETSDASLAWLTPFAKNAAFKMLGTNLLKIQ